LFTGEQPLTTERSGGGVKNRVIEIEAAEKIVEDGPYVASVVKENYGWAGRPYIDYVRTILIADLRARHKDIMTKIINTCNTTDKQAISMALILLADELSCECLFVGDTPLTVADVAPYLRTRKAVDVAERAYDWTINWIARNANKFVATAIEVYGKMDGDYAMINKDVLASAMTQAGYDLAAVTRKWTDKGYLVPNSQGRVSHHTTVYNIKARYVKLALEPHTNLGVDVMDTEPVPPKFA